jgi:hypothetical protein
MPHCNQATPVAACGESVPNGAGLGSGLAVPDRPSMPASGVEKACGGGVAGVDTR